MPEIKPKNLSAQLDYRGRGNPPNTHPRSFIANCFPGLEFDFRNVWKMFLVGIELHESANLIVNVEPGSLAVQQGVAVGHELVAVDGHAVEATIVGPRQVGEPDVSLRATNLEWTNSLAEVVAKAGQKVACRFRSDNGEFEAMLEVRNLFEGMALSPQAAEPGALTQGLCSPWQSDYRECGCYYWAASRPDFVNVEVDQNQQAAGHNWMLKNRQPTTPRIYTPDNPNDPNQVLYEDLYRDWEGALRFIISGQDEQ
jgi:hypothetical protein